MVEPVTTGIVGAYVAKKLAGGMERVLGPSADVVGGALARMTENRLRNVGRIVENADGKVEDPSHPGLVPERVANRIFDEGSYSSDEVVVEYLGGVLASARTPVGRDDRANTWAALVSRLSTYDLRTHYMLYSLWRRYLLGTDIRVGVRTDVEDHATLFVSMRGWGEALELDANEDRQGIWDSMLESLQREGLMKLELAAGKDYLAKRYPAVSAAGMVVTPTVSGVQLFMWAHGRGMGNALGNFIDPALELPAVEGVTVTTEGTMLLTAGGAEGGGEAAALDLN